MMDWSTLPDGVLVSIARLIDHGEDFVAFRGTCSSWRAATSLKDFNKWLPSLMLNRTKDGDLEFFSLYKKQIFRVSLPEANGNFCIGSKGWFIMIGSSGNISLLHPITRFQIQLPKLNDEFDYWVQRAVLSASPSKTSDYVVIVTFLKTSNKEYLETPTQTNFIGFWKPGDSTWTVVKSRGFRDVSYYNGQLYCLSHFNQVWMIDVPGTNPQVIIQLPHDKMSTCEAFFVECDGRLLVLLSLYTRHHNLNSHRVLELFELDVINGGYTNVSSLGNKAVFIGNNEGFCVDAMRFIQPNYIYFSNGSYQLVGCEGRMDISPELKAGIFYDDAQCNPLSSNCYNVWVKPQF